MTADYPDWMGVNQLVAAGNSPLAQEIAAAIATGNTSGTPGGAFLLASPNNISAAGPITVPAGTSGQVVPLNGNNVTNVGGYLSYEVHARATCNGASTTPFFTYLITWYQDSAASIPLYRERWTCAQNSASGGTSLVGAGPVRGAYMQLTVTNEDAVNSQTINGYQVTFSSRPFPNLSPDWRTLNIQESIPGYNPPTAGQGDDGILGIFSDTIPVSTTAKFVCGLFNGEALVSYDLAGNVGNVTMTPQAYVSGSGIQVIGPPIALSASPLIGTVALNLPRSNLILQVQNASAAVTAPTNIAVLAASQF